MEKINYGNATYSLAEIDIRSYIELLKNIDETLVEPIETMNLILKYNKPDQIMCKCLKEFPLRKFCEVNKHLTLMKKNVAKHENRIADFLNNNPSKREDFDNLKESFNTLFNEKSNFVNICINKCFEFLKEHNCQNGLD